MSDWLISQVRTYVPIGVGWFLSWLATYNIDIDSETQAALVTGLTALLIAVYFTLASALQKKWPWLGVLLGSTKQPTYTKLPPADDSTRQGFSAPSPN